MPVKTKNDSKKVRNVTIAQDRIANMSYREIAEKHSLSKMQICRILKDDEIKEIVEQGQTQAISMIPLANNVYYDRLTDNKEKGLQFQAARDIKKMAGILPSNVTNQTINNIFNMQNNITLNPGVSQALGQVFNNNDEDIIEVSNE